MPLYQFIAEVKRFVEELLDFYVHFLSFTVLFNTHFWMTFENLYITVLDYTIVSYLIKE